MPPLRSALLFPASLFLVLAFIGLIMVIDRCSLASASVVEPLEVAEPSPTAGPATPTQAPADTPTPTPAPATATPTATASPTATVTPTATATEEPATETPEPGTATVEPETVTVEPGTVTVEPGTATSEPETVTPEPETPTPGPVPDTPTPVPDTPTATAEPATSTSVPEVTETVLPTVTGTPVPGPEAESYFGRAEYPREMETGRSDVLTVSLIRAAGIPAETVAPGNVQVVGTLAAVGTPGAALEAARGAGFVARATANLDAVAFDVEPASQPVRGLPVDRLDWQWTLRSSEAGQQVLIVSIDIEWTPEGGGPAIVERLWSQAVEVKVTKPFVSFGTLQLATLVSGFLGSGLSIPFIYGLVREHQEKRGEDGERASGEGAD